MFADFENLDAWLATRCGQPLPIPPSFTPYGSLRDPTMMLVHGVPADAINLGGMRMGLEYEDSEGGVSARVVRLRRAWLVDGFGRFTAFCEMRSAPRQFAFAGVLELTDLQTGEVHKGADAFFVEFGVRETDAVRRIAMNSIRGGMQVLMALAVADGLLVADEIEIVVRYAHRRAEQLGTSLLSADEKMIAKVAARMRPDLETAEQALDALRSDREHLVLVLRSLRQLAHADDSLSIEEESIMRALGVA